MNANTRALLLIIPTLLVLSACATRLDYASPLGVDLSGTWLVLGCLIQVLAKK